MVLQRSTLMLVILGLLLRPTDTNSHKNVLRTMYGVLYVPYAIVVTWRFAREDR